MVRIYRQLSIFFFVVACLALLVHATALVLRLTMDIRNVFPVDYLSALLAGVKLQGNDALVMFFLSKGVLCGLISQGAFLLSHLMLELGDVAHFKLNMPETCETQLELLKENEKTIWCLPDRIVPLALLCVCIGTLIGEWQRFGFLLANPNIVEMTRRAIILPSVTLAVLGWAGTFLCSLIISLVFFLYFRAEMLRLYEQTRTAMQV